MITARDYQVALVEQLIREPRGGAEACTGSGKSLMMALLIERLQLKTLVIVPNLGLKRQLTASFTEWFGSMENITIENIDSPRLEKLSVYDVLVLDEVHHAASATYQRLNKLAWKGIYHRYFFSATYFRNQENESLLLEGVAGRIKARFGYEAAVRDGAIVPVEAYYIEMPKRECDGDTWAQVYSELVVNYHDRNVAIANLAEKLVSLDKATLVLVREIKHGEALAALTGFPFANGKDGESAIHIDRFNSGKELGLIATTGVCGEGIDTKPAEWIVIAGLGKAKSAFQQQVGRGVRRHGEKESAKIILIRDRSHKFTLRHYNEQVKILKEEYGITPVKLEGD